MDVNYFWFGLSYYVYLHYGLAPALALFILATFGLLLLAKWYEITLE